MAIINSEELLRGGMDRAVELMAVAASTALKFGKPKIKIVAMGPEEFQELSDFCAGLAEVSPLFDRDGRSFVDLAAEDARALLIGAKRKSVYNYDCGACGYRTCEELNKAETTESVVINGPCCHFVVYDVHMAASAAAAAAWRMGLHCRVFQTIGGAAAGCGLVEDVDFSIGVGVSYQPQNPFFDRRKYWSEEEWAEKFAAEFPSFTRGFMGAVE